MASVELIFDADCPNVEAARMRLRLALDELSLPHKWLEWDRADANAPSYVKGHGSPTVLVDGRDVAADDRANDSKACRVYIEQDGKLAGAPPVHLIRSALQEAGEVSDES